MYFDLSLTSWCWRFVLARSISSRRSAPFFSFCSISSMRMNFFSANARSSLASCSALWLTFSMLLNSSSAMSVMAGLLSIFSRRSTLRLASASSSCAFFFLSG